MRVENDSGPCVFREVFPGDAENLTFYEFIPFDPVTVHVVFLRVVKSQIALCFEVQHIVQQFIDGHNLPDEGNFVVAEVHRIHGGGEGSTLLVEAGGWVRSDILTSFNRGF